MAPRRRYKRLSMDQLSLATLTDLNSVDSKEQATQTYLDTPPEQTTALTQITGPSYTSTRTWKSPAIKDKEEYERLRQRVRHFAPEQFKANAKPGFGRCEIFPQNVAEWLTHKKEMLAMAEAENLKNQKLLKDQIEACQKIPKTQRKIKSVFGEGGKTFNDLLSPVLALPSIWSKANIQQPAPWPTKAELQHSGDSGESSQAKAKCSRPLPPPHAPADVTTPSQELDHINPFSFDATGPVFPDGPSSAEIYANNREMDNDPDFEASGSFYLGEELMEEIGKWRPPFVPEWRKQQAGRDGQLVIYEEDGMFETPDVDDATWQDDSMVSGTWEEQQMWY